MDTQSRNILFAFAHAFRKATGRNPSYLRLVEDDAYRAQCLSEALAHPSSALNEAARNLAEAFSLPDLGKTQARSPREPMPTQVIGVMEAPSEDPADASVRNRIAALRRDDRLGLRQALGESSERFEREARAFLAKPARASDMDLRAALEGLLEQAASLPEIERWRLYATYVRDNHGPDPSPRADRTTEQGGRGDPEAPRSPSAPQATDEANPAPAQPATAPAAALPKRRRSWVSLALATAAVVALVLGLPWLRLLPPPSGLNDARAVAPPRLENGHAGTAAPALDPRKILTEQAAWLRIHGSNTVGAQLAPALAEAFLRQEGLTEVFRLPGDKLNEQAVLGMTKGKPSRWLDVRAHGSGTAFSSLEAGLADLGASSRPAKAEEAERLSQLGDLYSAANEHVVALDGVAIIVHSGNPLASLSKKQVADIFTGQTLDWADLGGPAGPITVYARDDKSGTFDTFAHLVLGKNKLVASARRYEANDRLAWDVSADPSAIGFTALAAVGQAKALAISDGNTAIAPTHFTIATEDYPLSRRLYFYTPRDNPPQVQRFLTLALADTGQAVVADVGFVDQRVVPQQGSRSPDMPKRYLTLSDKALRLSFNLRMRPDSLEPDNKATRDLERLVRFMVQSGNAAREILLFGFVDADGKPQEQMERSQELAAAVARRLHTLGLYPTVVEGFGAALPLASNDSADGRQKNRRVEVWVR